MTVKLREVGRKVSGKNEAQIRAAVTALVAILDSLTSPDADGTTDPNAEPDGPSMVHVGSIESNGRKYNIVTRGGDVLLKEVVTSDTKVPPSPTLDDVRKNLQALIDTLPASAKEQLEGDGDGDNDPDNAVIQGKAGSGNLKVDEESGKLGEAGADTSTEPNVSDPNANPTVHHDHFTKMSDEEQIAHLKGTHGKGVNRATMTRPGRIDVHEQAHASEAPAEPPERPTEAQGSIFAGDLVPLIEKALARDGTTEIKVIRPGWGSSGYYSADVLERDGPKAFPSGTKMFWDHPTQQEERDRPERSLKDLAAEFVEDAKWVGNHPKGPGLYTRAKVFEHFRPAVNELAQHIGVSIRALGKAKVGEAEGKKGPLVEELRTGQSVDFVTVAGAGGKILQQFAEAAGRTITETEDDALSEAQLKEAQAKLTEAQTELARYREAAVLRETADSVRSLIDEHARSLPDITRERLHKQLIVSPPLTEAGALDTDKLTKAVREAINAETEYLSKVVGTGRVRGFGGASSEADAKKYDEQMTEAFRSFGLSDSVAKQAATGRR